MLYFLRIREKVSIQDGVFKRFENLVKLDLQGNSIESLSESTFEGLVNLVEINLSSNKIEHVSANLFSRSEKLKCIDLSINLIRDVDKLAFKNLINLEKLNFYSNRIGTIDADLFTDLKSLKALILVGNKIKSLDDTIFSNLESLEELSLSSNKLEHFQPELVKNLANLKTIIISFNDLKSIDKNIFRPLRKLEVIRLGNNQFEKLDPGLFAGLSELQFIDVHQCNLTSIEPHTFHGLKKLRILQLNNNLIEAVHPDLFKDLVSLQLINLSWCRIKHLSRTTFVDCKELVSIYLRFNKLEYFNWKCLNGLAHLEKVDLSLNQLKTLNDMEAFLDMTNQTVKIYLFKSMNVDLVTLFNDLFLLNKDLSATALNECVACGSLILHSLSVTNDSIALDAIKRDILIYAKTHTALDYVIQNMNLSSTFILNLINMLQTRVKNNSIVAENNNSIDLKNVSSFLKLCELSISVELLDYMFRMNRCRTIKHDFTRYFEIALKQNNERLAICILEYMLDSIHRLILSDLWVAFHAKRWWNLFEFVLERCTKKAEKIIKYEFELLEYVEVEYKNIHDLKVNKYLSRKQKVPDLINKKRPTELSRIKKRDYLLDQDNESRTITPEKFIGIELSFKIINPGNYSKSVFE